VDAAFMSFQQHDRGIQIVFAEPERVVPG